MIQLEEAYVAIILEALEIAAAWNKKDKRFDKLTKLLKTRLGERAAP